jgi:hypothetical protein
MKFFILLSVLLLTSCSKRILGKCQVWKNGVISSSPNCKETIGDEKIEYDELGFVKELDTQNENRQIHLFGNFSTSGELVSNENRMHKKIEKHLSIKKQVKVANLGMRGVGVSFYVENFEKIYNRYKPQFIVLLIEPKMIGADYIGKTELLSLCPFKMIVDFNVSTAAEEIAIPTLNYIEELKKLAEKKNVKFISIWTAGAVRVSDILSESQGCSMLNYFISSPTIANQDFMSLIQYRNNKIVTSELFPKVFMEIRSLNTSGTEKTIIYYEKISKIVSDQIKNYMNL